MRGLLGAGVLQLLGYLLNLWLGSVWQLVFGLIYIVLVLFVPYGIVGTWQQKSFQIKQGRERLIQILTGRR